MCAKNNTTYMWGEQAIMEWPWHVNSIIACRHSVTLCELAARAFRSSTMFLKIVQWRSDQWLRVLSILLSRLRLDYVNISFLIKHIWSSSEVHKIVFNICQCVVLALCDFFRMFVNLCPGKRLFWSGDVGTEFFVPRHLCTTATRKSTSPTVGVVSRFMEILRFSLKSIFKLKTT